jgi:hypothetical protein
MAEQSTAGRRMCSKQAWLLWCVCTALYRSIQMHMQPSAPHRTKVQGCEAIVSEVCIELRNSFSFAVCTCW